MSEHEPKPVAYRWTYDLGQAWSLGPNAPTDFRFGEPDEIQPLYPASVVTALQEEVTRLRAALADERKRALEEAATIADDIEEDLFGRSGEAAASHIAAAIRALKEKP